MNHSGVESEHAPDLPVAGIVFLLHFPRDTDLVVWRKDRRAGLAELFPTEGANRGEQFFICQENLVTQSLRHLRVGFIILGEKIEVLVCISEKRLSAADIHEGLGRDHAVRNDPVSGKILHPTPAKRPFLFIGEL